MKQKTNMTKEQNYNPECRYCGLLKSTCTDTNVPCMRRPDGTQHDFPPENAQRTGDLGRLNYNQR